MEEIEPVRQHLVDMAVKFLTNAKVVSSPLEQKKAFLEKKGLTKKEIETATSLATSMQPQSIIPQSLPPNQNYGVPQVQTVPYTRWQKFRDVVQVFGFLAGLTYAGYCLYKKYLYPYLFGMADEDRRMKAIESSVDELKTTLKSVLQKVSHIQNDSYRSSMDHNGFPGGTSNWAAIDEIKSEIQTLKGLYLSRQQFPDVPKSTPVLPSWQLVPLTENEDEKVASSPESPDLSESRDKNISEESQKNTEEKESDRRDQDLNQTTNGNDENTEQVSSQAS